MSSALYCSFELYGCFKVVNHARMHTRMQSFSHHCVVGALLWLCCTQLASHHNALISLWLVFFGVNRASRFEFGDSVCITAMTSSLHDLSGNFLEILLLSYYFSYTVFSLNGWNVKFIQVSVICSIRYFILLGSDLDHGAIRIHVSIICSICLNNILLQGAALVRFPVALLEYSWIQAK